MPPHIVSTLNRPGSRQFGPYSELSVVPIPSVDPTVYLLQTAGQVGGPPPAAAAAAEGGPFPTSFREQAVNAFANVAAVLALKGATPRDVTKITIFVPNLDTAKRDLLPGVITDFLLRGGSRTGHDEQTVHQPPSSLIGVAALASPEFLIEVEASAVVAAPGSRQG
ncbi:hypothetical protein H2204_006174 [Knufia peltigerae]|uniref:Enamine deaminase RidA (YjgF/YER057c/UK114 family) n=1 Tax=Knufia peltigerae TaxID=1002370 RepID=A0AA38Y4C1_9EURO|nr:hypothetical protein H2204_006174 [Knufia peltigerae]